MSNDLRNNIINTVTRMLARREHAFEEVLRKLAQKGLTGTPVEIIVDEFRQSGIQSDARFAEMKVRAAANKGQGPARIMAECQQLGVDERLIEEAIAENDIDWFALAKSVKEKKYGAALEDDFKEKQKQMRFLQYRGFEQQHIMYAINDQ